MNALTPFLLVCTRFDFNAQTETIIGSHAKPIQCINKLGDAGESVLKHPICPTLAIDPSFGPQARRPPLARPVGHCQLGRDNEGVGPKGGSCSQLRCHCSPQWQGLQHGCSGEAPCGCDLKQAGLHL